MNNSGEEKIDPQQFHAAMTALLDRVQWTPVPRADETGDEATAPYATHEGVLDLPGLGRVPVYQLNTGERVVDGETLEALLGRDTTDEETT